MDITCGFNVDGAGGDPLVVGRTGIEVAVTTNSTASQVAAAIDAALSAVMAGDEFATVLGGSQVTVDKCLIWCC
jgi:hypothetical protein